MRAIPMGILGVALLWTGAGAAERVAPLTVREVRPAGVSLIDPRIVDRTSAGAPRIVAFVFNVTSAVEARGAETVIDVTAASGASHHRSAPLPSGRKGDVRVPFDLEVPRDQEGSYVAKVQVIGRDGEVLFDGVYGFGYPRYHASRDLERLSSGAVIRDDFDGDRIDASIWATRRHDPGRASDEQRDGRYWVQVTGNTEYNGLNGRQVLDTRDLVAVCRTGIGSRDGAHHQSLVHLCGSAELSPDHWFEVGVGNPSKGSVTVTSWAAVPPSYGKERTGSVVLPAPAPAEDGFLVKVECRSDDNTCRGLVLVRDEWVQVGEAIEVPARTTKLEIKTSGFLETGDRTSTAWFDDCRVYPRPASHYVFVQLRRPDGPNPGTLGDRTGRPICFDSRNRAIEECNLEVELRTADGKTVIDRTGTHFGSGWAPLRLARAPWNPYPASAIFRVYANGERIGPDHHVRARGVDGLYPDDVYAITLD